MARANNKGWDFVKVGETYQYKEDRYIAMVKVLEDNSTDSEYKFKLQVLEATDDIGDDTFNIGHAKDISGYYSGMLQIYEQPEYMCDYKYKPQTA